MPSINGLELTSAVRALDPDLPIIVVSGDDIEERAVAVGASAFVRKTSMAAELAAVIQRLEIHARAWPGRGND